MAEKRQGENEVEHPRKKNCFAVRKPSLAVADVLRQSGRVAMPQYCKLPTACLRSVAPEAFSSSTSTSIREDSGTKTEASHGEGFISALHRGLLFRLRKNTQVRASLNSRVTDGPRLPRGIPRFLCRDLPLELCLFAGRRDRRLNDSRYSDVKSYTGDNRERPGGSKVGKRKAKTNPF